MKYFLWKIKNNNTIEENSVLKPWFVCKSLEAIWTPPLYCTAHKYCALYQHCTHTASFSEFLSGFEWIFNIGVYINETFDILAKITSGYQMYA